MGREFWKKYWAEITSSRFNKELVVYLAISSPFIVIVILFQSHLNVWSTWGIITATMTLCLQLKGRVAKRIWKHRG
jgi:hypothetical protein